MAEQLPPHRINPAVYAEAERFTDGRITTEVLATCAHRMGVPLYVDGPEPGEKLMGLSDFLAKPQPTPRVDPLEEALDIAGDPLPLDAPPIPKPGHVTPFVHDSPEVVCATRLGTSAARRSQRCSMPSQPTRSPNSLYGK